MSSSDDISSLIKQLDISDPEELEIKEIQIARVLFITEDSSKLIKPIREAGIRLGDKSLIKISALLEESLSEECRRKTFGPIIEINKPLSSSVRNSFFIEGTDLYLITPQDDVPPFKTTGMGMQKNLDPEVRLVRTSKVRWRVQKMNKEKSEFEEMFISHIFEGYANTETDTIVASIASVSDKELLLVGVKEIQMFKPGKGKSELFEQWDMESSTPHVTYNLIKVARYYEEGAFFAIVSSDQGPRFGTIETWVDEENTEFTVFYPSGMHIVKKDNRIGAMRVEGIKAGGGFEIFFGKFLVFIVWRMEGPFVGVFDGASHDFDYWIPSSPIDFVWIPLKVDELKRITKISETHFNIGPRTFKINKHGFVSELTTRPMQEIQKKSIDSNVIFFDDVFYYFRGEKLYAYGKSGEIIAFNSFFSGWELPVEKGGTNHLLVFDEDLYWIHLRKNRTGFITKLCFPLIGVETLPPTLRKKVFPKKRKLTEPVEF